MMKRTKPSPRAKDAPRLYAYSVIDRPGKKALWHRIGSVWPHEDGSGFRVKLASLPLDGKIELRTPFEE